MKDETGILGRPEDRADRANATITDLVKEDVAGVKSAGLLNISGIGVGALTSLGSVIDGGFPISTSSPRSSTRRRLP